MRRILLVVAGLGVLVGLFGWLAVHGPPGTAGRHLIVGQEAPGFALPDQDGKIVRLAAFRGVKTVVLAFYVKSATPG